MKALREHPIRAFAVLCVAVISIYVMWMGHKAMETLSSPGWCRNALGAEKVSATDGAIKGLDACVGLFIVQLKAIANVAYTYAGTLALGLLTLIVIVIAKGRVEAEAGPTGAKLKIGDGDTPPIPVVIEQPPSQPVPTTDVAPAAPPMVDPSTLDPNTGMPRA